MSQKPSCCLKIRGMWEECGCAAVSSSDRLRPGCVTGGSTKLRKLAYSSRKLQGSNQRNSQDGLKEEKLGRGQGFCDCVDESLRLLTYQEIQVVMVASKGTLAVGIPRQINPCKLQTSFKISSCRAQPTCDHMYLKQSCRNCTSGNSCLLGSFIPMVYMEANQAPKD